MTWHFDTTKASPANTAALTADSHRKAAKEVHIVGEPIFFDLRLYGFEGHLFETEGMLLMISGWKMENFSMFPQVFDTIVGCYCRPASSPCAEVVSTLTLMLAINHIIACCWYGVATVNSGETWLAQVDSNPSIFDAWQNVAHWIPCPISWWRNEVQNLRITTSCHFTGPWLLGVDLPDGLLIFGNVGIMHGLRCFNVSYLIQNPNLYCGGFDLLELGQ